MATLRGGVAHLTELLPVRLEQLASLVRLHAAHTRHTVHILAEAVPLMQLSFHESCQEARDCGEEGSHAKDCKAGCPGPSQPVRVAGGDQQAGHCCKQKTTRQE